MVRLYSSRASAYYGNMDEKYYWLGFSVFNEGIGPKRFQRLLRYFGSAENIWNASEKELQESGCNIGEIIASRFISFKQIFSIEKYLEDLRKTDVQFVTLEDDLYPALLRAVENPPFILYVKGNLKTLRCTQDDRTIGIVGTRKITNYGTEVTRQITQQLVSAGYVIISGLAFGVDSVAHKTTIETQGKTIAVLGCGVDCCSPREHQQLYDQILKSGGAIVSEYPLHAESTKGSFPSRNRIIAGLSQAVIVTEGAEDSGALYTAHDALKLGRPVFAVPGPITSQLSKGPLSLVKEGAHLVTSVEKILEELTGGKSIRSIKGDTKDEQGIIDLLQNETMHFDEMVKKTKLDSSTLGILLSLMEMKGLIRETNGIFSLVNG